MTDRLIIALAQLNPTVGAVSANLAKAKAVIMMSGHGTIDTAVEATRLGAFDFLEKPIALPKLLATVERALLRGQGFAEGYPFGEAPTH